MPKSTKPVEPEAKSSEPETTAEPGPDETTQPAPAEPEAESQPQEPEIAQASVPEADESLSEGVTVEPKVPSRDEEIYWAYVHGESINNIAVKHRLEPMVVIGVVQTFEQRRRLDGRKD